MTTSTDTNESTTASACPVCRQFRKASSLYRSGYTVIPSDGGGWMQWSAALLRLLERTSNEPTRALIIQQPDRTDRYVQMLVGHGIAHVEASSNTYLEGASRLSGVDERLLTLLGWVAPNPHSSNPADVSTNWTLPLIHGDWTNLVETVTATLVGIFRFSEQLPVELSMFLADRPCRSCSWPDEEAELQHEIDDSYGTLGF